MQLADAAWRLASAGTQYDPGLWEQAVEAVRAATATANEAIYSRYGTGEKAVLRLLAGGQRLFGAAAEVLGVAHGTAQNARDTLVSGGDIVAEGSQYRIVDPVLADWVRRRFPG